MSDKKYLTRMGDGEMTYMTKEEIREDVLAISGFASGGDGRPLVLVIAFRQRSGIVPEQHGPTVAEPQQIRRRQRTMES